MSWNLSAGEFVPRPSPAVDAAAAKEACEDSWEDKPVVNACSKEAPIACNNTTATEQATKQLSELSMTNQDEDTDDVAPAKSLNGSLAGSEANIIDSCDTFKETLSVVFIGHVDAGKSTTAGHILVLTGQVDPRLLERYEREAKELGRESWYLSWTMDLNPEERAKGKTVECGTASFETPTRRFNIVDAPGHKNFVPNMLSGASQGDIGILVISARRGEFETGFEKGGQTREHIILAKTAGLKKIIIAINKMDDPTVDWSHERYEEISSKVAPFLKLCGFVQKDVYFLPMSGYTGANIKDRLTPELCPWYSGPSLLEYLDNVQGIERNHTGPLRIAIADRYKENGTVVAGKIESGCLEKGQTIMVMPGKMMTEAQAIFREDVEIRVGRCGESVRIRLKNIDENHIGRGSVICDTVRPLKCVRSFEAHVMILEVKNLITSGYTAVMHVHNLKEEITLGEILLEIDKKTGKPTSKKPVFLRRGDMAVVRIDVNLPVCMDTFDVTPSLGRFTLRDETMTVASGRVTKVFLADD